MIRYLTVKTSHQAENERKKLKSFWSRESQLSQRVLIRCLELLEQIEINTRKRSRGTTEYGKFLSRQMKLGRTLTQAVSAWKERKTA